MRLGLVTFGLFILVGCFAAGEPNLGRTECASAEALVTGDGERCVVAFDGCDTDELVRISCDAADVGFECTCQPLPEVGFQHAGICLQAEEDIISVGITGCEWNLTVDSPN